jgi:hypothetical protein
LLGIGRMNPTQAKPSPPEPIRRPVPTRERNKRADEPDFAEEAAPKTSEFGTEKDAKDITSGDFDRVP